MTVLEKIKRCVELVWDFEEIYDWSDIEAFCGAELNTYPQHDEILDYFKHIAELEKENAELNKLRCCENCKNVNLQLHWRESEEVDKRRQFVCGTCGNRKHWEYFGKTVGITEMQQLINAKDLLKQWLQTSKASGCDNINIVTDTEQFLKECK